MIFYYIVVELFINWRQGKDNAYIVESYAEKVLIGMRHKLLIQQSTNSKLVCFFIYFLNININATNYI